MRIKQNISKSLLIIVLILSLWTVYASSLFMDFDWLHILGIGLISCLGFYFLLVFLKRRLQYLQKAIDYRLDSIAIDSLLGGSAGLLLGVIVGGICTYPFSLLQVPFSYLTIVVFAVTAYLGLKLGSRRGHEMLRLLPVVPRKSVEEIQGNSGYKVLDTSAIIDGRIYDVCLSNFIDGLLIVPTFVIEELQHIADSSDSIRRNKGRRGLELLSKMQKHSAIKIDIIEANTPEEKEVDARLVCLCKQLNASIVTNDYNLNKVCELQGIKVLNINELANAVKVIVYPGEHMQVNIIKEGKENGQGVGYLEDGTMVVVENAQDDIGSEVEVIVTSVFQTAAGRMIFTRKLREEGSLTVTNAFREMQEVNLYG